MPVKPLAFKGDKARPKKRKHHDNEPSTSSSTALTRPSNPQAQDQTEEDETWLDPDSPTDLAGPIILVLPTSPPTCLASDAHGNVFASPLENIVENNPVTAEPHDVRQVWVVSRVAGMAEGEISLKGSHGGFLSCDEHGILGARREARGFEENFLVEAVADDERVEGNKGVWRMRANARPKGSAGYIAAVVAESGKLGVEEDGEKRKKVSVTLRGDGEKGSGSAHLVIRMQARFKPKVQRDREQKKSEKISRAELERVVGRRLEEEEVKRLKRAKRNGTYHEEILDVRVKGKHDKFA